MTETVVILKQSPKSVMDYILHMVVMIAIMVLYMVTIFEEPLTFFNMAILTFMTIMVINVEQINWKM